ncbi:ATP-binding protein [Aquimarina sp. BL5]|uniref:ATP-binding protein n=1 Tax=Aquimarina sp. BL5 TaxID=1714860 RepID=UPI000E529187|nr:ATP-binding protein [Aquimarina sp. BL5]AXT52375.1 ATP-binding protein [Aquimarina sp. BL5]RKN10289.1 AAA family ATPase [Aquimarina sp. BL5]
MNVQALLNETKQNTVSENAEVLHRELDWLYEIIHVRIALHFNQEIIYTSILEVEPPTITAYQTPYSTFIKKEALSFEERLLLILALTPHIQPTILDVFSKKDTEYNRRFTAFGGVIIKEHNGFIPTAETAMFLLAGENIIERIRYQYLFTKNSKVVQKEIISISDTKKIVPIMATIWLVTQAHAQYLIDGTTYSPEYGPDFPAQPISTTLNWEDLVVSKTLRTALQEIRDWIQFSTTILQDLHLGKRIKPGYKSLFYGPPGTGKSMAAAILGKSTGKPVYRIDLSLTVSKYIGETEKNLAKVFDLASQHDWILFFDEADSLFGKRTQVSSANDRYGNQEIGYLLQRIEDFPGVVILASNLKDNIDDAFTRRFQSMIEFKVPDVSERYQLWKQSFAKEIPLAAEIDLWYIAEKYKLSGGIMMNVVRRCTLQTLAKNEKTITQDRLENAIKLELIKEGILLS